MRNLQHEHHNTSECSFNTKANPKPEWKDRKDGDKKKEVKKDFKKKASPPGKWNIRSAEVESSDESEDETPRASSSKLNLNTARIKNSREAYLEEVEEDDEPTSPSPATDKGKGRGRPLGAQDFLRGTM